MTGCADAASGGEDGLVIVWMGADADDADNHKHERFHDDKEARFLLSEILDCLSSSPPTDARPYRTAQARPDWKRAASRFRGLTPSLASRVARCHAPFESCLHVGLLWCLCACPGGPPAGLARNVLDAFPGALRETSTGTHPTTPLERACQSHASRDVVWMLLAASGGEASLLSAGSVARWLLGGSRRLSKTFGVRREGYLCVTLPKRGYDVLYGVLDTGGHFCFYESKEDYEADRAAVFSVTERWFEVEPLDEIAIRLHFRNNYQMDFDVTEERDEWMECLRLYCDASDKEKRTNHHDGATTTPQATDDDALLTASDMMAATTTMVTSIRNSFTQAVAFEAIPWMSAGVSTSERPSAMDHPDVETPYHRLEASEEDACG